MKEKSFLVFVLLTVVAIVHAQLVYDPVPDGKAVVTFGRARFTILTPTLIRMQLNSDGKDFDDRATIQIVNRKLPVPEYTVTNPNTSTVVIKTSKLTLTHITTYIPDGGDTCANPQQNTDEVDGVRVPDKPNGISAASQADCCGACNKDKQCQAWVYATNAPGGLNCWLMMSVQGTTSAGNRVFGGSTGGNGFTSANLRVEFTSNGKQVVWTPDSKVTKNLGGTVTALDCYSTKEQCLAQYLNSIGPGLLTMDGWYVLDDTKTPRYDASLPAKMKADNIPWFNDTTPDQDDLYFFGDGLNFRDTIHNYALVGGSPAMPPRTAFGVWWSRYFMYSQQQFISEVLTGYADNKLPLSHVVLDMDWHTEENSPGCDTWGGYTFNTNLFPQPQQFISWLHSSNNTLGHPVKLLLNVHPQSGVDHCQGNYDAFARAMGVDPASKKTIPCDFGNLQFASSIYSVFLDAEPLTGVDFWWTDYGGCGGPSDGHSLYWSNYYFDAHIQAYRQKRPLVLSRYGGLGNHRYPIGFSGDTFQAFITLEFEIQMTPTAANVLFGYWSHDIGGFHNGNGSPGDGDPKNETGSELLLRWVQFGAVAPIDRTHCDHCERRIWLFPHFQWMKHAFILRNALVPYLYTNSRIAYETGIATVHPMYYDSPSEDNAYTYNNQYMFGDDIVAAPISSISSQSTHTISKAVWLPSGTWSNWNGSKTYQGPTVVTQDYGVQDIPLFVKAGAIIPLQTAASVVSPFADPIMWTLFPGAASGAGQIYEDDGDTLDYIDNKFSTTSAAYSSGASSLTVVIKPSAGNFIWSHSRSHIVQIRGSGTPKSVTANGITIPPGTGGTTGWYISSEYGLDITEGALVISIGAYPSTDTTITVQVQY